MPGCAIGRYSEGQAIPADQIPRIVRGETTKAEILEWFGAPQSFADATLVENYMSDRELLPGPVVDLPFADVLVYRMTRGRLSGSLLLFYNQFRVDVASGTLVVFFDENSTTFAIEDPTFTNLMIFTYQKTQEKTDRLVVLFDRAGVLSGIGFRRGTEQLERF